MAKKPKEITPEDRVWMLSNELTDTESIIRRSVREYADSLTRTAGERDLQKEITTRCKELTKINPKTFKKLAKTFWSANFDREVAEHAEFTKLYERILDQ